MLNRRAYAELFSEETAGFGSTENGEKFTWI